MAHGERKGIEVRHGRSEWGDWIAMTEGIIGISVCPRGGK
jgi:hypothetical protein